MSRNIRDEIVEQRKQRIAADRSEGVTLPAGRDLPLARFVGENGLICEIKRRSPSRGAISEGLDAVVQAETYVKAGAKNLSVLTVHEGFAGSLEDLRRVKQAFPEVAVLRKDFLVDETDVEISWRAGADAVLLIAGMLTRERLEGMYRKAKDLGLEVLLEIHDGEDLEKARSVGPNLVGINSRDLETFRIDPLLPLKVRSGIDWDARVIYESGVLCREQAAFATSSGFDGILVGEAVVRTPGLVAELLDAMRTAVPAAFWPKIGARLAHVAGARPLVKICGLTREEDAREAVRLGADVLGFVFWDRSARAAGADLVRAIRAVDVPKVAVTVDSLEPVRELLEEGLLDAVQLHGSEKPEDCYGLWPQYYKAVRPAGPETVHEADGFRCPRVLLDAAGETPGGTGQRVRDDIVAAWERPLWLAGGIGPEKVEDVIIRFRPELIDLASGVEEAPGVKSHARMQELFDILYGKETDR